MNRIRICLSLFCCGVLTACPGALGVEIAIDNPGFEVPVYADGDDDWLYDSPEEGWGYFGSDYIGIWNPDAGYYGGVAPEGENVGYAYTGGGWPTGFAQVLTEPFTAGTTYTLTVEVGNPSGYAWGGYQVQLLAGGTPHATGDGSGYAQPVGGGGIVLAQDDNSLAIAEDTFETSTVTYTLDPALHAGSLGEPLQIRLLGIGGEEVDFDDVRLDAQYGPTLHWDGLGNGDWGNLRWRDEDSNSVDWIPDTLTPASAVINANTVNVAQDRQATDLAVGGGAVTVAANTTLSVVGAANFAEGTVLSLVAGADFSAGIGSIASVVLAGDATISVIGGTLDVASLTGTGGTLTKQGNGSLQLQGADLPAAAASLVLSGGTLRVEGDVTTAPGLTFGAIPENSRPVDPNIPNPGNNGIDPLGPTISEVNSWATWTTYVYTGQIYDEDGALSFYESIDDETYVKIDGQVVLHDTVWDTPSASGTVNVTPGWVDFEVRFNGGGGGVGIVGDMGFGFDPTGAATDVDPTQYTLPRNSDETTADLFRAEVHSPIDLTGIDLTVTADSTIDVVTQDSATIAAPTMEAGILTTTSPTNAPVTFQGVNIATTATRVGFDPQTPTTYGTIANNSTQPSLTIVKDGPSTWALDAVPEGATGTDNITWEVRSGTLAVTGSKPLGDRPVVMAGGTLTLLASSVVAITNPGFEGPVLEEDDFTWLDTPGWTQVGGDGAGIWNVTIAEFEPLIAPEGENVAYTENPPFNAANGLTQVLADTFEADTDYTLTTEVGNSDFYYWAGYSVQLLAGETVIAEDRNSLWPDHKKWATSTVEYTYDPSHSAVVGQPLEVRLLNLGIDMDASGDTVVGVEFDDVSLKIGTGAVADFSGIKLSVTEDSTLDMDVPFDVTLNRLTLGGGTLDIVGRSPSLSINGTTILAGATTVGINTPVPLATGPVTADGVTPVTVTKSGDGDLVLDATGVGLDATTFNVQGGRLVGIGGSALIGTPAINLTGGSLVLGSATDGADVLYDNAVTVTVDSTITAGGVGAAGPLSATLGSATKGVTVDGAVLTLTSADEHTLNIAGPLAGTGSVVVNDGSVNLSGGGTIGTMSVSGSVVGTGGNVVGISQSLTFGETSLVGDGANSFTVGGADLLDSAAVTLRGGTVTVQTPADGFVNGLEFGSVSGADNEVDFPADPQPTPFLAETEALTDTSNPPFGDNTTWVYWGEFFDADGTFSFSENIDDNVLIKIDDAEVLNDNSWNTRTEIALSGLDSGWHTFELRLGNAGGGAGPTGPGLGFSFDPDGGLYSVDPAPFVHPSVSGDNSMFRFEGTAPAGGPIDLETVNLVIASTTTLNLDTFSGDPVFGDLTIASGADLILTGEELVAVNNVHAAAGTMVEGTVVSRGAVTTGAGPLTIDGDYEVDVEEGTAVFQPGLSGAGIGELVVGGDAFVDGDLAPVGLGSLAAVGDTSVAIVSTGGESAIDGTFMNTPDAGDHFGSGIFATDQGPNSQVVTYGDTAIELDVFQAIAGDADGNRDVNGFDIQAILAANKFGTPQPADWTEGDFTGDNVVNGFDIQAILAANKFGTGPYAAAEGGVNAVPEPGTVVMLLVGALSLMWFAWRRPRRTIC